MKSALRLHTKKQAASTQIWTSSCVEVTFALSGLKELSLRSAHGIWTSIRTTAVLFQTNG